MTVMLMIMTMAVGLGSAVCMLVMTAARSCQAIVCISWGCFLYIDCWCLMLLIGIFEIKDLIDTVKRWRLTTSQECALVQD